jgi:hypothetical protein
MEIVRPRWSSSTFLIYAGGWTVLIAAASAVAYLSGQYGDAAFAAWALFIFAVLLTIGLWLRPRHQIAGGVFAVTALAMFVVFVAALWTWFGWVNASTNGSPIKGFHVGLLSLELIAIVAGFAVLRAFRFPFLMYFIVEALGLFVVDLLSDGGSWSAVVAMAFGLVLLAAGLIVDAGEGRPYGFWLHLGAGIAIGGALLYFWHGGDWHWSFIAVGGLVYIWLATATGRSSWAVLGYLGLFAAATHFTADWWLSGLPFVPQAHGHQPWVPPLVFAVFGFLVVGIGIAVSRREQRSPLPSGG